MKIFNCAENCSFCTSSLKVSTQWWLGSLAYFIYCIHWSWILKCWPQKRHMNFPVKFFQTELCLLVMVSSSDRVHFLLASQWDISLNLSKSNWIWKEQRKHCSCCQTDAYPICNKSAGHKRSIGNCFSTMIFKRDFFYNSSLEPLKLLNGLPCDALPRFCPLFVVCYAPAVCLFGYLVPYD